MGHDGVFPARFFGFVHPTWRTPALNVLLVGLIALSAVSFDLVTAAALINFGTLVAFSFVNLSVIAQFWLREQCRRHWRDHLQYLLLPLVGVLKVGLLWLNLEASSMMLGLSWGAAVYLLLMTRGFRRAVPQYREELAGGNAAPQPSRYNVCKYSNSARSSRVLCSSPSWARYSVSNCCT